MCKNSTFIFQHILQEKKKKQFNENFIKNAKHYRLGVYMRTSVDTESSNYCYNMLLYTVHLGHLGNIIFVVIIYFIKSKTNVKSYDLPKILRLWSLCLKIFSLKIIVILVLGCILESCIVTIVIRGEYFLNKLPKLNLKISK